MKKQMQTGERGFLKWIIMIAIAIIIASYFFDFNVQKAVEDEQTQSNFKYITTEIQDYYNDSIKPFIIDVWNSLEAFFEELNNKEETTV
tara:strand:+ start:86 stop:352 length:267 start_codon:yes stop_codon:yes gene_type:complete